MKRYPVKIAPLAQGNAWIVTLPDGAQRRIEKDERRARWEQYGFAWNGACAKGFETLEGAVRACATECRIELPGLGFADAAARNIAASCDRDLNEFTKTLRKLLRERTGRDWSVTRGRGTAYSWCRIHAPKARCDKFGEMGLEDQIVLSSVLGQWVHAGGESIRTERGVRGWYILKALGANTDGWDVADQSWD